MNEFAKYLKNNRLSKPTTKIDFCLDRAGNKLDITLKRESVVCNMQTNEAAFEGWAICFKARLPANTKVVLDWELPIDSNLTSGQRRHYTRFKYRACNFLKLYDWFEIAPDKQNIIADFKTEFYNGKENFVINTPITSPQEDASKKDCEAAVERAFLRTQMKDIFSMPTFNAQLPVGIFKGKKSSQTYYFTGGHSAIDLWGLSDDESTLHIFELKYKLKYKNKMVGIITELLFYMCLMDDLVSPNTRLTPEQNYIIGKDARGCDRLYDIIKSESRKINNINGYFLYDELHKSVDNDSVLNLLNSSQKKHFTFQCVKYAYDNGAVSNIERISNDK